MSALIALVICQSFVDISPSAYGTAARHLRMYCSQGHCFMQHASSSPSVTLAKSIKMDHDGDAVFSLLHVPKADQAFWEGPGGVGERQGTGAITECAQAGCMSILNLALSAA